MFGFDNLNQTVNEMAEKVEAAGYSVDASYGEEYVKIIRRSDQKVMTLLENEDAIRFIEDAERLATDAKTDIATTLLAEAKFYADTYSVLEG